MMKTDRNLKHSEQRAMNDEPLSSLFGDSWESGRITRKERHRLATNLSQGSLSPRDEATARRLLYATKRGWIQLD